MYCDAIRDYGTNQRWLLGSTQKKLLSDDFLCFQSGKEIILERDFTNKSIFLIFSNPGKFPYTTNDNNIIHR